MVKIIALLKRNVLLIKKYVPIFFGYSLLLPYIYIGVLKPDNEFIYWMAGFMMLFIMSIVINNTIELADENNKRVVQLLCSAPYSRQQLVLSSYLFDYIVFGLFWILLIVESVVLSNNFLHINVLGVGLVLFICNIYRGILLPFKFKFGYSKTKNIFALVSFIFIFGFPVITNFCDINKLSMMFIQLPFFKIPYYVQCITVYVIAITISIVSYFISVQVYNKREFN